MSKKSDNPTFEEAMMRLEQIIAVLESGGSGLDESIAAFEEGVGLLKYCNERLDDAEKKVRILIKNESGEVSAEDFVPQGTQA